MLRRELWIGCVLLKPLTPGDWSALEFPNNAVPHAAGAYSNVITWASDSKEFRLNAEKVATDWQLYVVDIQDAEPLRFRDRSELSDELEENASRAKSNPNAIIFGTFHMYSHEEA
jgi:hypothetical protein